MFLKKCKMNNFFLPQLLQLHVAPHNPWPLTHISFHWTLFFFQEIIFLHCYLLEITIVVVLSGQHVLIKSLLLILEVYCAFQSWYKLWTSSYAPSHWHPLLIMPKVNFVAHAFGSNDSFHMFLHFLLLFNLDFT